MNPYEELGLKQGATKQQIQAAYRKLAMRWHPDLCKDPQAEKMMVRINRAYDSLMHPERQKVQRPVYRQQPVWVVWQSFSFHGNYASSSTNTGSTGTSNSSW